MSFDFGLLSAVANPDIGAVAGRFVPSTEMDLFIARIPDLDAAGNILDLSSYDLFSLAPAQQAVKPVTYPSNATRGIFGIATQADRAPKPRPT